MYESYRRMALGQAESAVARWWRLNRWTMAFWALIVALLLSTMSDDHAKLVRVEQERFKMAKALMAGGACLTWERPTAYFVAGNSAKVVDDTIMKIASQMFELKQAWATAEKTVQQ